MSLLAPLVLGLTACGGGGDDNNARPDPASRSPNVIVIFTDDHGFADLGINGIDEDVQTPFTDELARSGTLFTHGFVTAPQCSPSRAGLLTGIYQGRFDHETNRDGPLLPERVTIAERMKSLGYRTGMAGKWHLGIDQNNRQKFPPDVDERPFTAQGQGFDEYFEGERTVYRASHDAGGHAVFGGAFVQDDQFRVDAATQWGRNFIRRHADESFFLYLPYFAPHVPLEAPASDRARFETVDNETRQIALAMLHAIDRGVGEIRAELQAQGLTESTLIIYAGDNGAPIRAGAWNGSLNTPLTGEKGMLTDGGLRVPYIIAWPGTLPAGQVYSSLVSTLDIAPTALAVAGVDAVPEELEGKNLLPALQNPELPAVREELFWRFKSQAAVRTQDWKLIALGDGRRLLYDLRNDAVESIDQSEAFPDQVQALQASLQTWGDRLDPPGLPNDGLQGEDRQFYAEHGLIE